MIDQETGCVEINGVAVGPDSRLTNVEQALSSSARCTSANGPYVALSASASIAAHDMLLLLHFQHGRLRSVQLAFADPDRSWANYDEAIERRLKEEYDALLVSTTGAASAKLHWGEYGATFDPKSGGASIYVSYAWALGTSGHSIRNRGIAQTLLLVEVELGPIHVVQVGNASTRVCLTIDRAPCVQLDIVEDSEHAISPRIKFVGVGTEPHPFFFHTFGMGDSLGPAIEGRTLQADASRTWQWRGGMNDDRFRSAVAEAIPAAWRDYRAQWNVRFAATPEVWIEAARRAAALPELGVWRGSLGTDGQDAFGVIDRRIHGRDAGYMTCSVLGFAPVIEHILDGPSPYLDEIRRLGVQARAQLDRARSATPIPGHATPPRRPWWRFWS